MGVKNIISKSDKFLIWTFYVYLFISFTYNCMRQSATAESVQMPVVLLMIPFALYVLFVMRIIVLRRFVVSNSNNLLRAFLFLAVIFACSFVFYIGSSVLQYKYQTYIFSFFYPVTAIYFIYLVKVYPVVSDWIVKINLKFFLAFFGVYLMYVFITNVSMGYYGSLNTSYYLLFIYPICLLDSRKKIRIVTTVMIVIAMFISMKRGGILSLVVGFLSYYFVNVIRNVKYFGRNLFIFVIVVVVLLETFVYVDQQTGGTISKRFEETERKAESGEEEVRELIWASIVEDYSRSDVFEQILGHGPNAVQDNEVTRFTGKNFSAHNDYLEFLYDYGLIGLFVLLYMQLQFLKYTYVAIKNNDKMLACIFCFVSILVLSMVSHVLFLGYFLVMIPFWAIISEYKDKQIVRL